MFAPLAFVLFLSFRIERMSASAVQTAFWAFATVMGVSMATIFMTFTGMSIGRTYIITAIMFGGVSLGGYTTKRDMDRFSNFRFKGRSEASRSGQAGVITVKSWWCAIN